MLARARKFTPEEVRARHQSEVRATDGNKLKTTPEKFAEYLAKRAEVLNAKKGMVKDIYGVVDTLRL